MTREAQEKMFDEVVARARELIFKKRDDYATTGDVLSNFKRAGGIAFPHLPAEYAAECDCLALIATKVARLGSLLGFYENPKNEPLDDTILDGINYLILLWMLRHESDEPSKWKVEGNTFVPLICAECGKPITNMDPEYLDAAQAHALAGKKLVHPECYPKSVTR